jgi:hypothetical protein
MNVICIQIWDLRLRKNNVGARMVRLAVVTMVARRMSNMVQNHRQTRYAPQGILQSQPQRLDLFRVHSKGRMMMKPTTTTRPEPV